MTSTVRSISRFTHDTPAAVPPVEIARRTDDYETVATTQMPEPRACRLPVRRADLGLVAAVVTAAAFGTSGPFAKALLTTGWSSGAIVLLRVGIAALVLAVPAVLACRGRWSVVRANVPVILVFGLVAVAGCQVAYFNAVGTLSVGVALLLEYSGTVLVVLWVWLRTRRAPSRLTLIGAVVALAGLALVLDIAGQTPPDLVGVMWGLLAAVGLAAYFVASSHGDGGLPPVALAGFGWASAPSPWPGSVPSASSRCSSAPRTSRSPARRCRGGWPSASWPRRRGLRLPARHVCRACARRDRGLVRRAERGPLRDPLRLAAAQASCPGLVQLAVGRSSWPGSWAVRAGERNPARRKTARATSMSAFGLADLVDACPARLYG
jgi:drug/metabolite transporter (DMT)-like permease